MTVLKTSKGQDLNKGDTLIDLVVFIWDKKIWLLWTLIASMLIGLLTAFLIRPIYYSEGIIAPKALQHSGDPFSQLKTTLQLGSGNSDLNKMETVLNSVALAETVVSDHHLEPLLFSENWDPVRNVWKNPREAPSTRKAAERLMGDVVITNNNRKNVLNVGVFFTDSVWAARLANYFIDALNQKMKTEVTAEADANRDYLESIFQTNSDPMLRVKLQELIGDQIEKSMLVNAQSIDIWETPIVPTKRSRPERMKIMILSFFLGLSFYGIGGITVFFARSNMQALRTKLKLAQTKTDG